MKDLRDEDEKKAPDGGWGWFVCFGSSLISLSLRSLDPSFGLLFHDLLIDLNIDSTGTSLIMSILDAIVNFSGLFVGPLLKKFTYRKVAIFGCLLSCTGLILTSEANSMTHIICTYSVLSGLGIGLALASSFVALNTFFDKKRGRAVGFSMAGTTLAMMLVPQMVHALMDAYGFRGTMMIVGAWAMHSVVGACLLRPLETPTKRPLNRNVEDRDKNESLLNGNDESTNGKKICSDEDHGKSGLIDGLAEEKEEKERQPSCCEKVKYFFDFDLLKDTTYLNVVTGLSLYYVAESNFKLMTPFFLRSIAIFELTCPERQCVLATGLLRHKVNSTRNLTVYLGMSATEVAFCLSITAFTDILARVSLPTIFDKFGFKKRNIFWISSVLVGIGRSVLAEQSKGAFLIVVLVVIGFLRGATLVNLNLSVSECCSLKKLPSAFGMFMFSKGLIVVAMSPLIGYVRDYSESYSICIHVMTCMITVTSVMWSIEYTYKFMCKRKYVPTDDDIKGVP